MTKIYEIGPFRLDSEAGVLSQAGIPVALGSRAVAVLTTLVERRNEFVQKGAIMDAAWPGVVVEESNLAVQISSIRRVLAQVPGGERWIETLARRGYRFVGPVIEPLGDRKGSWGDKHTNLSEPLTSFIGRERELVEIKRLLPSTRLLTLVGIGGIGKTRLALQLAAEVTDAYRDGVWLVEVGPIRDPLLVPTSVAQVLGVHEKSGTPLTDTLCVHLKARQLLLVLDNCEHLLDACATLADAILGAAPESTIIATSREPLHVAGEQIYPLQSLSLPEPSTDAEAVGRSEAVQLFVERARRQLPDFELTAARASAVANLCVHLDGIPLALELAAARVRSLSIEQINARLNDRFKLLTSGMRAALPRQQTLRATLDWSFDLLGEQERVVLRRLAVFSGGFTLEAASAVASNAVIDQFAVIDLLSQLVARSLVIADTADAGTRYRLLETTRAYALEKLVEAEETDGIRLRHAQYFREMFEDATDDWMRIPEAEWRAAYAPELDNVRAALDWALGAGAASAIGIGLVGGSGSIWLELPLRIEGRRRLEAAIARADAQTPEPDRARLWLWLGLLSRPTPAEAVAALEQASKLYRRMGDFSGAGFSLMQLAAELTYMGRFEQAMPIFAEAFPLLERTGSPKLMAEYFLALGTLKALTGDLASARLDYEKAASLCEKTGAERLTIGVLCSLAETNWMTGDLDAALAGYREAVMLARKSPVARRIALGAGLTNLAGVHTERGELCEALLAAREGLPLRNEGGFAWVTLDHLALRAALAGKTANAARLAGHTDYLFAANESSRQPNEARSRERLQGLLIENFSPGELERLLEEGAQMSEDEACRTALEE